MKIYPTMSGEANHLAEPPISLVLPLIETLNLSYNHLRPPYAFTF